MSAWGTPACAAPAMLLLWAALLLMPLPATFACHPTERRALLELKSSMEHANRSSPQSWDGSSKHSNDCCAWEGVGCDAASRRVVGLELSSKGVETDDDGATRAEWNVNSSIFSSFPELRYLNLAGNKIGGSLAAFVSGLTGLKNLSEVGLTANSLTGLVPAALGNLSSLRSLDLRYNHLSGEIPTGAISSLALLENLYLSYNSFVGRFPLQSLANLSNLYNVDLSWNEGLAVEICSQQQQPPPLYQLKYLSLSGCTLETKNLSPSACLANQSELKRIDLSHTGLQGRFPSWLLENNTGLGSMHMSGNSLTGEIDLPSRPMLNLNIIDLSINSLGGPIPANFSSVFPNVFSLNLSMNRLIGNIPPELFDLWSPTNMNKPMIGFLDLCHNQLGGPLVYDRPSTLLFLRLSNNSLRGEIPKFLPFVSLLDTNMFTSLPSTLSDDSHLTILDVHDNRLSGNLPPSIWNQSELIALVLRGNQFNGEIPQKLCNLASLTFLDLSQNSFSGTIPDCPEPLLLEYLSLAGNDLTGSIPGTFFNFSAILTLDVGMNKLSDDLNWIQDLHKIRVLLLNQNHFEGLIPIDSCTLRSLRLLDLSHSNLSGLIPPCWANTSLGRRGKEDPLDATFWELGAFRTLTPNGRPRVFSPEEFVEFMTMGLSIGYQIVKFGTKGRTYSYKGRQLSLMFGIDLSANRLTGQIPPEIGELARIQVLNLSYNQLMGSIPPTLSNLQEVESLDISHNKLTGVIPYELVKMRFLAVFSVAYNSLSGCTPGLNGQFSTFNDVRSFEGNIGLHGPPLDDSCKPNSNVPPVFPREAYHDGGNNNNQIDDIILYGVSATSFVVFFWITVGVLLLNQDRRLSFFHMVDQSLDICLTWISVFKKKFKAAA